MLLIWNRSVFSHQKQKWRLVGKEEGQNIFSSLLSSVALHLLPLWAQPGRLPALAPALAPSQEVGASAPAFVGEAKPPSPTQEMRLIFAQGVICWHDSHKQQTPLINVGSEHQCCSSVRHPGAYTCTLCPCSYREYTRNKKWNTQKKKKKDLGW